MVGVWRNPHWGSSAGLPRRPETGAAAAAWLGARALTGTGRHGRVLPILLLNGLRMGGGSLLSGLPAGGVQTFLGGLGYRAVTTTATLTRSIRRAVREGLGGLRPLDEGPSTVVVVTVPKGHGAPESAGGHRIVGTPRVHKTPLTRPRQDPEEFAALAGWLAAYRPRELINLQGAPTEPVSRALDPGRPVNPPAVPSPQGRVGAAASGARAARAADFPFGAAVAEVVTGLHRAYGLRIFSPDGLASNRLNFRDGQGNLPPWIIEVLNEELCHLWTQGYLETGRRALVVSYEGFAPIVASLLAQHLTHRRLAATAGRPLAPSITYLLTSLGWQNTVSHANPGLVDIVLATGDPSVHVYTPADAARTAAAVTFTARQIGQCNLIVSSKHPTPAFPLDTVESELRDGYSVWSDFSDPGPPELVVVSAGDIAARELTQAARALRTPPGRTRIRYLHVHDLTCLGSPATRPAGIPDAAFAELIPPGVPALGGGALPPSADPRPDCGARSSEPGDGAGLAEPSSPDVAAETP